MAAVNSRTSSRLSFLAARQRGAALLLMLALVGLGAASLLMQGIGRADLDARPQRLSAHALRDAKEALIGYAVAHGRLPRPALPGGRGSEFDGHCNDEQSCTGLLPWVTLGLAPGDGYGKLLRYSVTAQLTSAPVRPTLAVGTKAVVTRRDAELVYLAGAPECTMGSRCAAAVVLSMGRDNGGISLQGVAQAGASTTNLDERANAGASATFMARPLNRDARSRGGEYDDQLVWVPFEILLNRMSLAGKLPRNE